MTKGTIFLAAGGTGGHLFPASALARNLLNKGYAVHLLTDDRGLRFAQKLEGLSYSVIKADTIRPGLIGKLRSAITIGRGYIKSLYLTKKMKPAAIVGFGGYPSFPPVLAAAHCNVPIILHEQNAVLGKANRALARYAEKIALSFDRVDRLSDAMKKKIVLTGNPVRRDVLERADIEYIPPSNQTPFHLVVMGGSQGARVFSDIMPQALALLPKAFRKHLQLVQQCRPEDLDDAKEAYKSLCPDVSARLESFIDDVPDVLSRAHLVITRAGASTVAELTALGRPAIFVPLPGSLEGDQAENAKNIANQGGGWLMPEDELTPEKLYSRLESLMHLPEKFSAAAKAARTLGQPDADEKLAGLVIQAMEGKK